MTDTIEQLYPSCAEKQQKILARFQGRTTPEEKYQKIIELGKELPPLDAQYKTEEYRVQGCQSRLYIASSYEEGKVYFQADADALISKGLCALLVMAYSGESAETILQCPPLHIQKLGLQDTLTPGRSSGLASVYLRLKQDALAFLLKHNAK